MYQELRNHRAEHFAKENEARLPAHRDSMSSGFPHRVAMPQRCAGPLRRPSANVAARRQRWGRAGDGGRGVEDCRQRALRANSRWTGGYFQWNQKRQRMFRSALHLRLLRSSGPGTMAPPVSDDARHRNCYAIH